jgi:rhodanese-related sulfurtransferase
MLPGDWVARHAARGERAKPLRVWLNPDHGAALLGLPYELVWATTWMHDANTLIAPQLGLPGLPVIEWPRMFHDDADGIHWKTRHVVDWAAGRPFAWVDDEFGELREVLELIAADGNRPLVFHCAAGKDRTGLVAALVLALVGVGEEDIVADYALSEPATLRMLADGVAGGRDPQGIWPGFGLAPAESMRMFLAWLKDQYGSVEGYAHERLGVGQGLVEELRARLLE